MAKKAHYTYNPATDNYERVYPTMKTRVMRLLHYVVWGVLMSGALWLFFGFHNETYIVKENSALKDKYKVLESRLNDALDVMEDIKDRDDNFYRVMMQMDPMKRSERYAGLGNEQRYSNFQKLSDSELLTRLSQNLDLLERQVLRPVFII